MKLGTLMILVVAVAGAATLMPGASATYCIQDPVGPWCEGQVPAGDRNVCWEAGVGAAHGTGSKAYFC